jgi:hypothetical protein
MFRYLIFTTAIALQHLISQSEAIPQFERRQENATVTSYPATATVDSVQNAPFQSMLSKFIHIKPTATPSSVQGQ